MAAAAAGLDLHIYIHAMKTTTLDTIRTTQTRCGGNEHNDETEMMEHVAQFAQSNGYCVGS